MTITLTNLQKKYIYSTSKVTAFCAARACGKTFATAFLIGNRMTHGKSVLAVAPTYPLLNAVLIKDTLDMFRKHNWKVNYNKSEKLLIIYKKDGSELARCYFRSADCFDTIRGISNVSVLVMDEAAYCERAAYEVSLACLRGENVRDPQVFLVSTPRGRSNWFSEVYMTEDVESIHGTSLDNPYIDPNYIKMLEAQYGSEEFARQEIYAEILDSTSAGYFKKSDIDILNSSAQFNAGEITFGMDIAGEGDDYSAIAVKQGNLILDLKMLKTPDDESLVSFLSYMVSTYPEVKKIYIDKSGAGHIPSRMQGIFKSIQIMGVHFSSSAYKDETFANQRAEMYDSLRAEIRKNNLHFAPTIDKKIREMVEVELYATEYKINNNRLIQLKKKEEIKKIIGRSPDISDALALACIDTHKVTPDKINKALNHLAQPKKYYNNKKG